MHFRITGLSPDTFRPLFSLSDAELHGRRARRVVVDASPGFPDRISLRDLEPGEQAILVHHTHQPAETPFHASHAIFVGEASREAYDRIDEVPPALAARLLSVRAFDAKHDMVDADVVEGAALPGLVERFFADGAVAYLHAHYARRGCYAARIDRA
jgi:hypothetical protein